VSGYDVSEEVRREGGINWSRFEPAKGATEGTTQTTRREPDPALPPMLWAMVQDTLQRIEARATGKEKPVPLPWPSLGDAVGRGLLPGLHVLVGNTGTGKSQFAVQVALHASMLGAPVLYVALETGTFELACRAMAHVGKARWSDLYLGRLGANERRRVKEVVGKVPAPPFYVEGNPGEWDVSKLGPAVAAIRAAHPQTDSPALVVVDYLQIVPGQDRELREKITSAARAMQRLTMGQNVAVLALSSTARSNYAKLQGEDEFGKGNAARFVGSGKESGEVEYAAHTVMVLGRNEDEKDTVHVAVAKARACPSSWVRLKFDGSTFYDQKTIPSAFDEAFN
jgi:replicative DNA helicase